MSRALVVVVATLAFAFPASAASEAAERVPAAPPALVVRNQQPAGIAHVAFSRDGRLLVSSSDSAFAGEGGANVWDARSLRMLRVFHAAIDADFVIEHSVVGFSPDGAYLVAGPSLFRVRDGALLQKVQLQDYANDANSFSVSPDGRYAVITASHYGHHGENRAAIVFDFRRPEAPPRVVDIPGGTTQGAASCFASDGSEFLTGMPLTAYALDGRRLRTLQGDYDRVLACAPNGRTFLAASFSYAKENGEIVDRYAMTLRDTRDGHVLRSFGVASAPPVVAYTRGGEMAIPAFDRRDHNAIAIFSATGVPLRTLHVRPPQGFNIGALAFDPSSNALAIASGGDLAIVDSVSAATVRIVRSTRTHGHAAVAVSPNRHWMSGAVGERSIVWDLVTGQPALRLDRRCTAAAAFSVDSRRLACADAGVVDVWSVTQSARLLTIHPAGTDAKAHVTIDALTFDPTGDRLFVTFAHDDGQKGAVAASVFDVRSARETRVSELVRGGTVLGIAPGNRTVTWPEIDGRVQRYDFGTGRIEPLGTIPASAVTRQPGAPVRDSMVLVNDLGQRSAISPDGRRLVVGPRVLPPDPHLTVYDVGTGTVLWSTTVTWTDDVVGFSRDGSALYLHAVCDCRPLLAFPTEPPVQGTAPQPRALFDNAGAVVFTSDERRAVATSRDATRIWDVAKNRLVGELHDGSPNAEDWLAIAPNGLFDGTLDATQDVIWRFNGNTLDVAPPEAFFNDFYEPGLLAAMFGGTVPAVRPLQNLDRRTPSVMLHVPAAATAARSTTVSLDVVPAHARTVDLFRNGTLVRSWDAAAVATAQGRLTARIAIVAGPNEFRAYAFNRDNVRGPIAHAVVTGAPALARRGVAHIVAIGLNSYQNPGFALRFAADDARWFAGVLRREASSLARYASIDVTPALIDSRATKSAILGTLRTIARRSQPEDVVYVYFAGHGMRRGARYYLLPYDMGYAGSRADLDANGVGLIVKHAISDLDLARAFAPMDVAGIDLILDSCESGGVLGRAERLGPMNSRGLAQLAYDKGMYVLTASQGNQEALELPEFGHGLLTYALLEQGVIQRRAAPDAQTLFTRPWFAYAESAVPILQARAIDNAARRGTRLAMIDGEERSIANAADRHLQRPRFYLPARSAGDDLPVAHY